MSAVATGSSVIRNLSLCQDVLCTVDCLRALGADITIDGTTARVKPIVKARDNCTLYCGNSGTTARLLAGLVCGLGITATFVGDESLSKRPMERALKPLIQMGAHFTVEQGSLFVVHPSILAPTHYKSEVNSAQIKGAFLLASMFANGTSSYTEKIVTRKHTEKMLAHFGMDITVQNNTVFVSGGKPQGFEITIPNDFSSLAYLVALAQLSGQRLTVDNVCLEQERTGFVAMLQRAGADISYSNVSNTFATIGSLTVQPTQLKPFNVTQTDVCNGIDEVMLAFSLALFVRGKHTFCNVSELAFKECNRIEACLHIAKVCNQTAHFDGKHLTLETNGVVPQGKGFECFGDHRVAMCESIICLASGGGSVDDTPFEVSFPNFLQALGVCPLRFGLIGGNVSQSLSPKLMQVLASNDGVCCSYKAVSLPSDINDDRLLKVINSFDGVNVTMPFKERVARLTNATLDSVNTVGKNILPTSTDGYGIAQALQDNGINVKGLPLWIIGAGGAGKEAVRQLAQHDCTMQVLNRTAGKIDEIASKYPNNVAQTVANPVGVLSFVPECNWEKNIPLPPSAQFVFVSAYRGQSGLATQGKQRGVKVIDGLQMLYHQGAKSFSLWTGRQIQSNYHDFLEVL